MSSIYQRFFLSKLTLAMLIIFSIYILLRTIAFFVHQPIPLSGDYFSFEGKQVRYVCKGSGNPYVFLSLVMAMTRNRFGHQFLSNYHRHSRHVITTD
ncbi:hypothetical protein PSFL107428_11265 [Pseudoalteromonas maricaloris]